MDLEELLTIQDGVVSRAQVLACGGTPNDIRRRRRRREWRTLVEGIYVNHTGTATWEQRAMAGVLHGASGLDEEGRPVGAALGGHAALRHAIGPTWRRGDTAPIEICVDRHRAVRPVGGYRFVRTAHLVERVDAMRTPPRLTLPEAVLDRALAAEDLLEVVSVVADACQSRCVSAEDIIVALGKRARVVGRADLRAVLTDLAAGTCSALEYLFVTYVVRAHGLPDPSRQVQRTVLETKGRRHEYRDAEWTDEGLTVELDGRTFHDNAQQRDRDLDRDLDDAVEGRTTVRLGWGQVTRRRCRTAHRLAALLAGRGWAGSLQPCPECP